MIADHIHIFSTYTKHHFSTDVFLHIFQETSLLIITVIQDTKQAIDKEEFFCEINKNFMEFLLISH